MIDASPGQSKHILITDLHDIQVIKQVNSGSSWLNTSLDVDSFLW